jgi:hypothetical protein
MCWQGKALWVAQRAIYELYYLLSGDRPRRPARLGT